MKQVSKPKKAASVNPRNMSGKDSIHLNIGYKRKSTIGYHKGKQSMIKENDDMKSMHFFLDQVSTLVPTTKKRYRRVTLDQALELLIYKGFPISKIFGVATISYLFSLN